MMLLTLFGCRQQDLSNLNETFYVSRADADMPAYVHGNGSEKVFLLVLHGAGSFGLAFRDGAFTEELESRYAVVYYDQRGQSMAQGSYASPDDIVDVMAEDVLALMEVLKVRYGDDIRLFLMGHSWGGMLSVATLLKGGQEHVLGWIDVDGAHDFPFAARARKALLNDIADEQIQAGNSPEAWQSMKERLAPLDSASQEDYEAILAEGLNGTSYLRRDGVVAGSISGEKLRRAILDNNPITWYVSSVFQQPFAEARDMEVGFTDQLGQISIPVLILFGKYDVSVPPTLGRDLYRRISSTDKSFVLYDHSLHHPHDTEPDKFADEVIGFIERNR